MPDGADDRLLTLTELEHWLQFGGTCRALPVEGGRVLVEMCTCTGELVERRSVVEASARERVLSLPADPEA